MFLAAAVAQGDCVVFFHRGVVLDYLCEMLALRPLNCNKLCLCVPCQGISC